jgi:hypothetical protein
MRRLSRTNSNREQEEVHGTRAARQWQYPFFSHDDLSVLWLVYVLDNWGTVVLFPVVGRNLFPFHSIQANIETHSPSYPVDIWDHSPGVKQPVCETDNSPLSGAKIKNTWSYTSVCQYVFMAWGLFKKRDNFTGLISFLQTSAMKGFFVYIKFLFISYNSLLVKECCMLHRGKEIFGPVEQKKCMHFLDCNFSMVVTICQKVRITSQVN